MSKSNSNSCLNQVQSKIDKTYYTDNRGQNNLDALTVYMTHAPVAIQRVKHELRSTRLHIHRGIPMKRATKIYCQRLPDISIFTSNVYFVNLRIMTWP